MVQKLFIGAWIVLSASMAAANHQLQKAEAVPGEYVIKTRGALSRSQMNGLIDKMGAMQIRPVLNEQKLYLVKYNKLVRAQAARASLRNEKNILIAEPNYVYRINKMSNDPDLTKLWGLENTGQKIKETAGRPGIDIGATKAWDITTGSKEVVVAVIDTGVNYKHADLAANMWTNAAEETGEPNVDDDENGYVDDIYGINAATNSGDPMDDHGHGTHCSGTIGGVGNDGAGIVGVAWETKIMAVKFLTATGSGTLEDAIKGVDYATKMKANIMSNSWGGGGKSELLEAAIVRARDAGILFVAAAGNNGFNADVIEFYPSGYPVENVLSVAAVDNLGNLAGFSNYGKVKVHVAAPGVAIYSSTVNGYDMWSGTSMATPHVSGVAVLMLAHEPALSFQEIKSRLVATSSPLASLRNKVASRGMVNAYYALLNTAPPPDANDPFNWATAAAQGNTEHPYKENTALELTFTQSGASQVSLYFSKFQTEKGFDFVEFFDSAGAFLGKWAGNHDDEFSPSANGETITLKFKSDHMSNEYGFDVEKIAYK